jgi:proteasome accessory factor C
VSRASATERLGRLLAIVPWVASNDGPTVEEVCGRFEVDEADLLADLDLLFLCGVHPFTPDTLIEVDVADGRVWIRFADYFDRPLRLTPEEGLALVAAGEALLSVPGGDHDGALAGALAKLGAVLGLGPDRPVDVELTPVPGEVLDLISKGQSEQRKVRIEYYSFGRDRTTTRVVHPWRVFNSGGDWYLSGWCEQAAAERLFRVDRIRRAELLPERFDAPDEPTATTVFHPDPASPVVVLDLRAPAWWIAESYPHEGVERLPGGVLRVRLRVAERAWLERVLLRAGPDATVVEGDRSIGPDAAARVLSRYRRREPGDGRRPPPAGGL